MDDLGGKPTLFGNIHISFGERWHGRGWGGYPIDSPSKKWPVQRSRKAVFAYFPQDSEPIPRSRIEGSKPIPLE